MNETRRIVRYVFPGLSFGVQFVLFVWLAVPTLAVDIVSSLNTSAGVGVILAGLFTVGGFGYIFSILHHLFHARRGSVNHSELVCRLRDRGILRLIDTATMNEVPVADQVGRRNSWSIVTSIWHERLSTNRFVKSADKRATSLTDLVHSAGTARVASIMAWVLSLLYVWRSSDYSSSCWDWTRFALMIIVALVLITAHEIAYRDVGHSAQRVIDETVYDAFVLNQQNEPLPIITHIIVNNRLGD